MANALLTAPAANRSPVRGELPSGALVGHTLLWIAASGCVLLWSLALFVLGRRIGGGLVEPLRPAAACAFSLGLCAAVLVIRATEMGAWLSHPARVTRGKLLTLLLLPGLPCLLIVVAITLPGTSFAAALWLYLPLTIVEMGSLAVAAWGVRHGDRLVRTPWRRSISPLLRPEQRSDRTLTQHALIADQDNLPPGVTQQLVRRRTTEGTDAVHGTLRVQFAIGQRTEIAHVAFCPPFDTTPRWTAKAVGGPAATIKLPQVFPYGARIEVRLNESPLVPVEAIIAFTAIESG